MILLEGRSNIFFASRCAYLDNRNALLFFYLQKSVLNFPSMAPTDRPLRMLTFLIWRKALHIRQKLATKDIYHHLICALLI